MKQIRILHLVPGLASGGISTLLLNYYMYMNRDKVRFDFAIFMPELGINAEKFKELGSKIYILPRKTESMSEYKRKLMQIIKDGNYDIVHAHQEYQSFIPLYYAKKCGIKIRIGHAHNTLVEKNSLLKRGIMLTSRLFNRYSITDYFMCSMDAGRYMFGSCMKNARTLLLKNAIFTDRFVYSDEKRDKYRKEFKFRDKLVIGNVGRLALQKNQLFLIDILQEVLNKDIDAALCICGEGPEREKITEYVKRKKLEDRVMLLGNRGDVADLMNAFDVCVITSVFEGFCIAALEASANGMPCILSDAIPREVDVAKKIKYISLQNSAMEWAEEVVVASQRGRESDIAQKIRENGYDIRENARLLEKYYMDRIEEA